MTGFSVRHRGGDHYILNIRGHRVDVDQPLKDGGTDVGPTPTELFVAGLAACVAHYAGRFFRRHEIAPDGFEVGCEFDMSTERPARVTAIRLNVALPTSFPAERREAFMRVVERCTVHNSLVQTPEVGITLTAADAAA